jgi:hypothetical protein
MSYIFRARMILYYLQIAMHISDVRLLLNSLNVGHVWNVESVRFLLYAVSISGLGLYSLTDIYPFGSSRCESTAVYNDKVVRLFLLST